MNAKTFFLKALAAALLLLAADRLLGTWLAVSFHRISGGEQGRLNRTMDSCRAATVILGSSRAAHHYVPAIIGAGLSGTCYNAGKDKQRLRYCLAALKAIYSRYRPQTIILDLNPTAFNQDENGLNELSALLPYYQDHPEIRSVVDERGRFERIKTQSWLYCYNSLPLKIIFNSVAGASGDRDDNGYVPLNTQKEPIPAAPPPLPPLFPVDTTLIGCFKEIIQITETHHSRLILVVSPIYYRLPENLPTLTIARSIAFRQGIPLLDFSRTESFRRNGPHCFRDVSHLNDSCARIFSKMLTDSIRSLPEK